MEAICFSLLPDIYYVQTATTYWFVSSCAKLCCRCVMHFALRLRQSTKNVSSCFVWNEWNRLRCSWCVQGYLFFFRTRQRIYTTKISNKNTINKIMFTSDLKMMMLVNLHIKTTCAILMIWTEPEIVIIDSYLCIYTATRRLTHFVHFALPIFCAPLCGFYSHSQQTYP